jgi:hypothetical protein
MPAGSMSSLMHVEGPSPFRGRALEAPWAPASGSGTDRFCALSPPAASLARDMGTTQGAEAPDTHAPLRIAGFTSVPAVRAHPVVAA